MTTDIIEIPEEQMAAESMDFLQDEFSKMVQSVLSGSKSLAATCILSGFLLMPAMSANANIAFQDNAPLEILVDNSGKHLSLCDAVICLKHHLRLTGDADRLAGINYGWDGLHAKAPSIESLESVRNIINNLDEDILAHCAVFPSNDGGVYLQGRYDAGRMSVFLNGKMMTVSIRNVKGEQYQRNQTVSGQHVAEMRSKINELLVDEIL